MKGIDSPLEIILEDFRIVDRRQSIIAQGKYNLKYGKIKIDTNLQMGLSLKDKDHYAKKGFRQRLFWH
jgi:hypothetical protein